MHQENKFEKHNGHNGKSSECDFVSTNKSLSILPAFAEAEDQEGDLLYCSDICWLSQEAMLARRYVLKKESGK